MTAKNTAAVLFGKTANLALKPDFSQIFFQSPPPAGRRITAGFSWMQQIRKAAAIDVWFPQTLKDELDQIVRSGHTLRDQDFPAQWAAVRQFELLQDAGNYKIYNMQADYLARSLYELTRSMRGGGYRVTVVLIGSYDPEATKDELEILDKRLQDRLSHIIHMLYLEEQSTEINRGNDAELATGNWDFNTALPHVGMTLGARDLFRPLDGGIRKASYEADVPKEPHTIKVDGWVSNLSVRDLFTGDPMRYVDKNPQKGEYSFKNGVYTFAEADEGLGVEISFMRLPTESQINRQLTAIERKHRMAQQFFDILGQLPSNHIVHDTAVGLQLPEMINENEWLYVPESDESLRAFNVLLKDVFRPLDIVSLSALDGRADAKPEIKATTQHMIGYGDRLTPAAMQFQRSLAQYVSTPM